MTTTSSTPARLSFGATATLAWVAGLAMIACATSVVGLLVAPIAIPVSVVSALRDRSWAVRIPLIIGAVALTLLLAAWLADGAPFGGTTVPAEQA